MQFKRKITSGKRNSRYYARGHINTLLGSDADEESFLSQKQRDNPSICPQEKCILTNLPTKRRLEWIHKNEEILLNWNRELTAKKCANAQIYALTI